ncbi:MAG: IS200/IS605 family transposase [Fibrobacteria bacterium]|nr:IS200/IS605 family transposase [Fibrobacteria bacterium]
MTQSLTKIYLHVVFSTKHRIPFLKNKDVRCKLHGYMADVFNQYESQPIIVGGVDDHIHALIRLGKNQTIPKVVGEVKRKSSRWIKEFFEGYDNFQWQGGYAAFSVGYKELDIIIRYIDTQETHHDKRYFKEELIELLIENAIEYDERYLWD